MRRDPRNQEDRILWQLQAAWPNWVPAPLLSRTSLQYGRAIHSLRRQGWQVVNRVRLVDGVRHGEFRLESARVPWSRARKENPAPATTPRAETLFGNLTKYRDPEEL